ncbi:MAG: acylphosphatase [Thermodesulfobacteriota bacterium]|jgi:acylphosphatase|nr:acylphosphatase [Thermodesulfobacteriota bacterium]
MRKIRAAVRVKGRVQGVNFRYETQRTARRNQVCGWVKNLPDGDVAAVFEGEEQAVLDTIEWCRSGPATARVDHIDVEEQCWRGEFSSFEIVTAP